MPSIETQLNTKRGILKFLRKDLYQIYNVGKAAVDGTADGGADHAATFLSMFPSSSETKSRYLSIFDECLGIAISSDNDTLFPTDEDIKLRTEITTVCYKIFEFNQTLTANTIPNATSADSDPSKSSLNHTLARSRLPKVTLPHFSGKIETWPKFKQLFISMIDSNSEIPLIEKYHYLSTSLIGEAQAVIISFTLSEENYFKAWDALCRRYDNKRLLATTFFDKILDYVPNKGPPSVHSLQSFIANIGESVASLKTVKIKDEVDFIWLALALRKLDPDTRKQFESHFVDTEWPSFDQLIDFIYGRCRVLQLSECSHSSESPRPLRSQVKPRILASTTPTPFSSDASKSICNCNPSHPLYRCSIFKAKTLGGRRSFLKGKIVCFNCLSLGHIISNCTSSSRCHTCKGKHHTLLHYSRTVSPSHPGGSSSAADSLPQDSHREREQITSCNSSPVIASVTSPTQVLLGTAEAFIVDINNILCPIRLLVDCCSQVSLITTECAKRLGFSWKPKSQKTIGVGETPLPKAKGRLLCQLRSKVHSDKHFDVSPLVVGSITGPLPSSLLNRLQPLSHISQELLADPTFWEPRPIDFLLGGDLFIKIITGIPIKLDDSGYEALPTAFGLIVMGPMNSMPPPPSTLYCNCITEPSTNEILSKFWETEEVSPPLDIHNLDPCEDHFIRTHSRNESGRYIVALPIKELPFGLEESYTPAFLQYRSLERRMDRHPNFKIKYHNFLEEYLQLGHMATTTSPSGYYIPHHGVFKTTDPSGKIRVVFNASFKTPNGSLNDKLYIGPKLQHDLVQIILKFRKHAIAVTADIVKMYRQILIRPEDRRFLRILWRPEPQGNIQTFELNTVTYGTASAPFQAIRCLIQLVKDEGNPYPLASRAILEDSYVDDIVSGADTLQEAILLRKQLIDLLGKGQFEIHKWSSNSPEFRKSFSMVEECQPLVLSPKDSEFTKVLGMSWDPTKDVFFYQVKSTTHCATKRSILSVIARLFDPMGYLAPVVFKAKTILQSMWEAQIDWDEEPEQRLSQQWSEFSDSLHHINVIRIPRFVLTTSERALQIIGFSDASQKGFAAAIYLRVISTDGEIKVSLLQAKTKLAPLKTISIPRLELSAAHLLVKLYVSMKPFIGSLFNVSSLLFFSDSTIVLAWLRHSPHLLQTFIANRVSFIVSNTESSQWFHVESKDNPADVASRGIDPESLPHNRLWWAGPPWLYDSQWSPPSPPDFAGKVPELRPGVSMVISSEEPFFISWMQRFSNYSKLIRILAYVKRFFYNTKSPNKAFSGPPSTLEMELAVITCIRITQQHEFSNEFSWIENRPLSKRLQILSAFADERGIIKVGGRLQNADLPEETKYPIILPGSSHLVILMINHLHQNHLHISYSALQALIRRRFWVFRLRQVIKRQLMKCLTCFKFGARPDIPKMGNLPACRSRPSRPFSECGVDYAGPFLIKLSPHRNASITKGYLCLFVCMSTRAVHLELVSSLTTDAFLATLDRFVARRGCPHTIFTDCGTNFVGAERRLKELYTWMRKKDVNERVLEHATLRGFRWQFIPPYTPHFGGIWEAAVKSTKRHLHRVTHDRAFYFEELMTLFTRIEAILNSRPICPLDDDPDHGDVLTPGHFLIGAPLLAIPEKDHTDLPISHMSRWQLVTNCVQHFWKRWHVEYLQSLQKRPKWYKDTRSLQVGDLVLLPDSTSLPLQWNIGRITECHPGNDSIVRVVTVHSRRGISKFAVHNLVSLSHLSEAQVPQK